MSGSTPAVNGSGSGSGQVSDADLQNTQNQAIDDMKRMTEMTMLFNMQMNRAKTAHSAAQANTVNG